jgi:hypothetical protein
MREAGAFDEGQGAELAFEVPLEVGGDEAAGFAGDGGGSSLGDAPIAVHEGVEQCQRRC